MKDIKYINRPTEIKLQNWWDIQDTNNYVYLQKGFDSSEEDHSEEAMEVYESLNNQIINKHGVSDSYLKILQKQKQYIILMCEGIAKENRHIQWKAERIQREIETMSKGGEDTREESLIIIGKMIYGRPISAMDINLEQYHSMMNHSNKLMASQNKAAAQHKSKK